MLFVYSFFAEAKKKLKKLEEFTDYIYIIIVSFIIKVIQLLFLDNYALLIKLLKIIF